MTLQEAINSGRPFRLPSFLDWLEVKDGEFYWMGTTDQFGVHAYEILCKDWEIQPISKDLTLKQILKAVHESSAHALTQDEFDSLVSYKLGFELPKKATVHHQEHTEGDEETDYDNQTYWP